MRNWSFGPDFKWIEVVTTAVLSAAVVLFVSFVLRFGAGTSEALNLVGAIGGAGLGAWLAVAGARRAEREGRANQDSQRRAYFVLLLESVAEEMAKGSSVAPGANVSVRRSAGRAMLSGHEARSRKALALLEDAKASVQGSDFRALHVIHRLQRTLESSLGEAQEWNRGSSDDDEVAGALAVAIIERARHKVTDIVREALPREPVGPATRSS